MLRFVSRGRSVIRAACRQSHAAQFSRWGLGGRCIPAETCRFAALIVALRSKYTRASSPGGGSSLARLVSRTPTGRTGPRPPRRSRHFVHRLLALAAGIALLAPIRAQAATAPVPQEAEGEVTGRIIAERWFRLLDDLDGSDESRAAFLALYAEDALHIQGPTGDYQRGNATYWGREKVGLLVDRLLGEWQDHSIRPEVATAGEVSETLWAEAEGPWGGPLIAVQFTIAGTRRDDETRWHIPGAAFFRVRGGELVRVRVYLGLGEAAEVEIQR